MIDPNVSVFWNKELKAIHPEHGEMKCLVSNQTGKPVVWGWSVWKRQGGYRTYGLSTDEMLSRGWVFYEAYK